MPTRYNRQHRWVAIILNTLFLLLRLVSHPSRTVLSQDPDLQLIESGDFRIQREGVWPNQSTPSASGDSYSIMAAIPLMF